MDIGEIELRIPTVSEINEQMVEFTKEYVRQKVSEVLTELSVDEQLPRDRLMRYIHTINFDDISLTINSMKRPRKKIDTRERCQAKTSKGDQCTRKRKDLVQFCGSHESSRPYGEIKGDSFIRTKPVIKSRSLTVAP